LVPVLSMDGQYTIVIQEPIGTSFGPHVGPYTLFLKNISSNAGIPIMFGNTVNGEINPEADVDIYTFDGNAGDTIMVAATETGQEEGQQLWFDLQMEIFDPDRHSISKSDAGFNLLSTKVTTVLATDGIYTIVIQEPIDTSFGPHVGQYTLLLKNISSNEGSTDIYSPITNSPPNIDGILESGEWLQPGLIKSLNFVNTVTGQNETHLMTVYSMHDDVNLYLAVRVSDVQYLSPLPQEQGKLAMDCLEIYFNTEKAGDIKINEDVKNFRGLDYGDWHFSGATRWEQDKLLNGVGKASHSNQAGIGDFIYEFQIPLNSGDPQDLAITPTSRLGILISFHENYWNKSGNSWNQSFAGEDFWPTFGDGNRFNAANYGEIILMK
jgi:hypothetical protein